MKPSILFVTNSPNWPLTDGKRQRTWFLIEALSEKCIVDVLLIGYQSDRKQIEIATNTIRTIYFVDVAGVDTSKINYPNFLLSKSQRIKNNSFISNTNLYVQNLFDKNKYEFLFSRYLEPLLYFSLPKNIKIICDIDDVYFEKMKSKIKNETNLKQKIKLQTLFHLQKPKIKAILSRIDVPIIVKKSDKSFFGLKNAVCLPNLPFGYFIKKNKMQNSLKFDENQQSLSFGFLGKLSYQPNYQGLINFISNVWNPLMKEKFNAKFIIAGSGIIPEPLKVILSKSKNIELLGFVETPQLFWDAISVLIVPVAEGAGSNIKIAEALIHGKKIIADPFASRGYEDFMDSGFLFFPKNDKNWIECVKSTVVISQKEKQLLLNKAENYFNIERWNETLHSIIS